MVLFATYGANVYSISYNLHGGTNNPSNPFTYTPDSETFELKEAIRDGYTFSGWNDGHSIVTTIEKGSYGNLVLDAEWTANKYKFVLTTSDSNK